MWMEVLATSVDFREGKSQPEFSYVVAKQLIASVKNIKVFM